MTSMWRSSAPSSRAFELKIMACSFSEIEDEDLGLLVDILVGNTTLEYLIIDRGRIPSAGGLVQVTRLVDASAIFKILQTRPAIFEKQLRRPSAPTTSARPGETTQGRRQPDAPDNHGSDGSGNSASESAAARPPQKRQRQS